MKFTDTGGISITASIKDATVIIEITNTCIGISDKGKILVWDEFRQESEGHGRHFEGTGLGLSIAKKYTELMGGKISVKDATGSGTTFTVEFPIADYVGLGTVKSQKNDSIKISKPHSRKELHTILYVEDDKVAVEFVSRLLSGFYLLDVALSGEEALKKSAEKKYDAIIMDINLSHGMNGIQVTKLIRAIPGYLDTPIIACTAYAMPDEKENFLSHGMTHYISKPFTRQELLSQLANVFAIS